MKKTSAAQVNQKVEFFERNIVFRTARGYFLVMAVCAVLVFAAGLATGMWSFVKVPLAEPHPPSLPAEPPAPKPLDYASVKDWITDQSDRAAALRQQRAESIPLFADEDDDTDEHDRQRQAELQELEALSEKLQALFPAPHYTWDDLYTESCATNSPYGCLRRTRTLEREGISRVVRAALANQSRHEALTTLRTLITVLAPAPIEERAALIIPTRDAYLDKHHDYLTQLATRELEIRQLERDFARTIADHERQLEDQQLHKSTQRTHGLYGIFGGLILLVLVSVFLVLFAIERHLRTLKATLAPIPDGTT